MAIKINKVIHDLPFFPFPTSSCTSWPPHAQNMTDDIEICKHTIFFHLSSCLHMVFPLLGMSVLSTSELCKVMCRWLCEAFVNHPQTAAPSHLETTTHGPLLLDSVMHEKSHCSYLWYKCPQATGGQCPWLVIIEEMNLACRTRNLVSLQ